MELSIYAESVGVNTNGRKCILEIEGVDPADILGQFSVSDIVNHFHLSDLLDAIGKEEAAAHFNLIDAE